MKKSISQQGNALIITVIIISTLVTVGLATSRSFMVELKNIRSFTGSEQAFYEAEAGVEHGLYAYRSDRRAELVDSTIDGMATKYSMAIYTSNQIEIDIPKDESVNLETGIAGKINISNYPADKTIGALLITGIKNTGSSTVGQVYPAYPSSITFDATAQAIRFHSFRDGIMLFVQCDDGAKCLANPQTTINAESTASGVRRTLEAKINRQSGLLQSLFDYTMFSQGDIK